MSVVIIGLAGATMVAMAVVLTFILGWANTAFRVDVDPRVDAANDTLPGANCGGCGYVGCGEYAEAIVLKGADVNLCAPGGESVAKGLARIMGVELGASLPFRPIVHCGAFYKERLGRHTYNGELRCTTANLVAGVQGCAYGCLGFGDCASVCQYDALHIVDGLSTIDYEKCVGCGACAKVCPRNIITLAPFKSEKMLAVTCSNKDVGRDVKKVCTVGCLGCKVCEKACSLFKVVDNLSTLNYDEYDLRCDDCVRGLQDACDKCPRKRLVFVGKPSAKDLQATKDTEVPEVVVPDFKTTVDDTEWRG